MWQVYENKLRLVRTSAAEAHGVVSAEDAIVAQQRILARRITGSKDTEVDTDLASSKRGTVGAGATETEVSPSSAIIELFNEPHFAFSNHVLCLPQLQSFKFSSSSSFESLDI